MAKIPFFVNTLNYNYGNYYIIPKCVRISAEE